MRALFCTMATLVALPGCDGETASSMALFEALSAGDDGVLDLAVLGPVRLSANGPVVADNSELSALSDLMSYGYGPGFDLTLPVVESGERPAVRWTNDKVELIVHVEREDARSWTLAETTGGLAPGSEAVQFEAGVVLEVLDQRDQLTLVRHTERDFWVDAWVPAWHVDQVRDRLPYEGAAPAPSGSPVWVRPDTDFFDGVDGPWTGRFEPARPNFNREFVPQPQAAVQVGESVGGRVPIAWVGEGVVAQVWVDADRLTTEPMGLGTWGVGIGGSSRCGGAIPPYRVLAGTELFDAVDGRAVGWVQVDYFEHAYMVGEEHGDGWRQLRIDTPWGDIETWVPPDSIESAFVLAP